MIRKNTAIVLIVFIFLLAAVLILQRTRGTVKLVEDETTATATSAPLLLANWQAQDIAYIEWRGEGQSITLTQAANGSWALGPGQNGAVDVNMVERLRSSLAGLRPVSVLGKDNPLDAIGLSTPASIVILRSATGQQAQLNLGNLTPTQSGYYAQIDNNPPVVVEKFELESILEQLKPSFWATPTPLPATPTAPATATP